MPPAMGAGGPPISWLKKYIFVSQTKLEGALFLALFARSGASRTQFPTVSKDESKIIAANRPAIESADSLRSPPDHLG